MGGVRCVVCAVRNSAGHGWLRSVCPDEVFTPQVELGIRRSLGLCGSHGRTLLTSRPSRIGLTHMVEAILGMAQIRGGRGPVRIEQCPVCRRAERAVERALRDVPPDSVLCLPDAERALSQHASLDGLLQRLDGLADGPAVMGAVAGDDPDAVRRSALSPQPASGNYASERLVSELAQPGCPLCAARQHATTRYLTWLADVGPSPYSPREANLCAGHAADLLQLAPDQPMPTLAGMLRQLWAARLRQAHPSSPECHACHTADEAERQAEAVLATLLADSAGRALPLLGFGPCHKHILRWRDRPTARLVRRLHVTRLRLAELDVRDEGRRLSWDHRCDAAPPAPSAAVQALALIDGEVFLGSAQHMNACQPDQAGARLGTAMRLAMKRGIR